MRVRGTVLVAAAVLAAVPPATAQAWEPGPGYLCALNGVWDPVAPEGGTAWLEGGPLVLVDDAGLPVSATLDCSIHAGGGYLVSASAHGVGVVYLGPEFTTVPPAGAYLCTAVVPDAGTPLYWNETDGWSTDAADCYRDLGIEYAAGGAA
jgi:hypothetical protein